MKAMKIIISTVGTSLLTNQIQRGENTEKDWYSVIRDSANKNGNQIASSEKNVIDQLKIRAINKLTQNDYKEVRKLSAEINGILGIYNNDFVIGKNDIHYLVATDTYQGKASAEIVKEYLEQKNLNVQIYIPKSLSTASTEAYSEGIDSILEWIDEQIEPSSSQYEIIFNLVGGFKSLQGYLNTIGMFYADKMVYIFEGENSELIIIPKLPIQMDSSIIKNHIGEFYLMNTGQFLYKNKLQDIPESLLFSAEEECTLSNWGNLFWNKSKKELIKDVGSIELPHIQYEKEYLKDTKDLNIKEKDIVFSDLAKVSKLLIESNGDY
jgi:putative CRISPR-associated protein (TIGR02619 family)